MKVRVVFYGGLKYDTGVKEQVVELAQESVTMVDLVNGLAGQYPALRSRLETVAYVVHDEIVESNQPVYDGDEVGLLPPVSGG
jgi:molybdopterin converting factor small subunit